MAKGLSNSQVYRMMTMLARRYPVIFNRVIGEECARGLRQMDRREHPEEFKRWMEIERADKQAKRKQGTGHGGAK